MQTREETQRGVKKCNSVNKTISFFEKTRGREANETVQSKRSSVGGGHERRNPINLSFDDALKREEGGDTGYRNK